MGTSTKVAKGKQKVGKKNNIKSNYNLSYDNIINYSFIALISIFLIIAPFYRGLYFRENYIPSVIFVCATFILYLLYKLMKKDCRIISTYLDIAILLLPFVYLISFFFSVNAKLAFDAVLKYAAYFMIYKIAVELFKGHVEKKSIIYAVIISNFLVAITGLFTMAGIMDLKGVVLYNRIYGLYQYPNTTGAILGAGFLISILTLSKSRNLFKKLFLQLMLTAIFAGFMLTLSLGAFLVFGAIALIFFIISDYKIKLNMLCNALISVLANVMVFIGYFRNGLKDSFIVYFIISMAASIFLQYIFNLLSNKYIEKFDKKAISIVTAVLIVSILIVGTAVSIIKSDVVKPLIAELWDAGLKLQNASDRITFSKDGMRIFLDNPLIGTGGGTWQDTYYKYQSFAYNSAEAHNFYIQFLTEVGIIGGIIFITIMFILLKKFIVQVFINKNDINMPIFAGIFMIIGHAFIDFDLSLCAPMFLLWTLIGVLNAGDEDKINAFKGRNSINYAMLSVAVIILYFSSSILIGMVNGNKGAQLANKDPDKAIMHYEKAMKLDKFNGAYRMDYAQVMGNKLIETKDRTYLDKFRAALADIEKYESQNVKYIPVRINLLINYGEMEKGVALANQLVDMQPLAENAYVTKIQANYQIAKFYFSNKKFEDALPYLNNIIETEGQLEAAKAKSIKPFEVQKNVYDMIVLAKNWKEHAEKRIDSSK